MSFAEYILGTDHFHVMVSSSLFTNNLSSTVGVRVNPGISCRIFSSELDYLSFLFTLTVKLRIFLHVPNITDYSLF